MDFKTSKPVQSIGAPPPATVSKIDARLNDLQRLDRMPRRKALEYAQGFLTKEVDFHIKEIRALKARDNSFDKTRIVSHESDLSLYQIHLSFLQQKFPDLLSPPKPLDPELGPHFDLKVESVANDMAQRMSHLGLEAIKREPGTLDDFLDEFVDECRHELSKRQGWPLNKQQIAYFNEHARGELSFRIQERLEGERNNGINQ